MPANEVIGLPHLTQWSASAAADVPDELPNVVGGGPEVLDVIGQAWPLLHFLPLIVAAE